eukprot:TRINITY_DN212_c0_g1_i1.p1 TRINITY_DN212_c0_g1~~TRINITY_DN212_c0_g1_i1.p1  ORF type:complete len:141 (-),score=33.34 TRINITY_DN212_c0_g1_i1:205-627(-)
MMRNNNDNKRNNSPTRKSNRRTSRSCKKDKCLQKKLLNFNFLKDNKSIFHLNKLSCEQMSQYLESKGYKAECKIFLDEKLDGSCLITLCTTKQGLDIMEQELGFSREKIECLLELYRDIFIFRKRYCNNLSKDERPLFIY